MEPHCLGKSSDPGRSGSDNRRFIETVLWIARTGSSWRDLPPMFENWSTAFRRFSDWWKANVFAKLFEACPDEPDMECATIAQAHCFDAVGVEAIKLKEFKRRHASRQNRLQFLGHNLPRRCHHKFLMPPRILDRKSCRCRWRQANSSRLPRGCSLTRPRGFTKVTQLCCSRRSATCTPVHRLVIQRRSRNCTNY